MDQVQVDQTLIMGFANQYGMGLVRNAYLSLAKHHQLRRITNSLDLVYVLGIHASIGMAKQVTPCTFERLVKEADSIAELVCVLESNPLYALNEKQKEENERGKDIKPATLREFITDPKIVEPSYRHIFDIFNPGQETDGGHDIGEFYNILQDLGTLTEPVKEELKTYIPRRPTLMAMLQGYPMVIAPREKPRQSDLFDEVKVPRHIEDASEPHSPPRKITKRRPRRTALHWTIRQERDEEEREAARRRYGN